MTHDPQRLDQILTGLMAAHALKDTFRSAHTRHHHPESVAAHSWALCLLILMLEDDLAGLDLLKLLKLAILHDLGEAISGDIPAIHQVPGQNKAAEERADLQTLMTPLPPEIQARFLALWDEYEAAETPEAIMAKGLDKLETMVQHVSGDQVADFDYLWNLGYGTNRTDKTPLLRALREKVDAMTKEAHQAR